MSVHGLRPKLTASALAGLAGCFLCLLAAHAGGDATCPSGVPDQFKRYFVQCADRRSLLERMLNSIGFTNQAVGRSFALVAGVDTYPALSGTDRSLAPAAADIGNLVRYLRDVEYFDEIVVLQNESVTDANLKFFLQAYFPERLRAVPRSRFLFAYSGHGFEQGSRGYLLQASATNLRDKANSIGMSIVRTLYQEIVDSAYQSLALINACHSGEFMRRSFAGVGHLLPLQPGHFAITSGGAEENSWHDETVGPGSIFFEKVFAGLDGRADAFPKQPDGRSGDGVITTEELGAYLRLEVPNATNQHQNPTIGDLSTDGSIGSFFFFDRLLQIQARNVQPFDSMRAVLFGLSPIAGDASAEDQTRSAAGGQVIHHEPKATPCSLRIAAQPSDASVYLDGRFLGTAKGLPAYPIVAEGGVAHHVEVVRPGFRSEARSVSPEQCSGTPITINLQLSSDESATRTQPQITGAKTSRPQVKEPIEDSLGFRFTLKGCIRSGPEVRCEIVVTNREEDRDLELHSGRLVDDSGNEYGAVMVGFGADRGYLRPQSRIAAGIPARAQMKFENVAQGVDQAALLELELGPPGRAEGRRFGVLGIPRVQFRSVPLEEE